MKTGVKSDLPQRDRAFLAQFNKLLHIENIIQQSPLDSI